MQVRHLRAADYRKMPWRNGKGSTVEIAREPDEDTPAQAAAAFAWRISLASVTEAGPFSSFAGYDRIIVQTEGPAMALRHGPGQGTTEPVQLKAYMPYAFSGDWQTTAEFPGAPATVNASDFNVMTRRDAWTAQLQSLRVEAGASMPLAVSAPVVLLYSVNGSCHVRSSLTNRTDVLARGETLLCKGSLTHTAGQQFVVLAPASAVLFVILLTPRA